MVYAGDSASPPNPLLVRNNDKQQIFLPFSQIILFLKRVSSPLKALLYHAKRVDLLVNILKTAEIINPAVLLSVILISLSVR